MAHFSLPTLSVGHDAFVNEQRLSPKTSRRTSAVASIYSVISTAYIKKRKKKKRREEEKKKKKSNTTVTSWR